MEHPKANSPSRPVIAMAIPDVTSASIDREQDRSARTELIRTGANQGSGDSSLPKKKKLTLFSVFFSYAVVGVIAAKLAVWLFGGNGIQPASNANSDANPGLSAGFEVAAAESSCDPAVSESLRTVLENHALSGPSTTDRAIQPAREQDAKTVDFIDW